jgi:anthranilate/para-aminobenzoate synthase component I
MTEPIPATIGHFVRALPWIRCSGGVPAKAYAGIARDPVPGNEWAETMNKGRAVFRAVAMVKAGLK